LHAHCGLETHAESIVLQMEIACFVVITVEVIKDCACFVWGRDGEYNGMFQTLQDILHAIV